MVPQDPQLRRQIAQQARLWLLALVCAAVGAAVVSQTDRLAPGIGAFLLTLAVSGPLLWLWEKRHRAPASTTPEPRPRSKR